VSWWVADNDREPRLNGKNVELGELSHGYIDPDMSATVAGKKSRDAAYNRVNHVLKVLRKSGQLGWWMVLDLTRELDQWRAYASPREARAAMRRFYDEDRWIGQPYYPVFIVEKDTLEPVCRPMAMHRQIPFASSRGYSSLKLQYDVAQMLERRYKQTGQTAIIYFISDHDPSGLDLQRAWEEALENFGVVCIFERIGLTIEQVEEPDLDIERLSIGVKDSDSRSRSYIEEHGDRCWEADILPASVIEEELDGDIAAWRNERLWKRRAAEIERARKLL
jgi:hypothetical protein